MAKMGIASQSWPTLGPHALNAFILLATLYIPSLNLAFGYTASLRVKLETRPNL